MTIIIIRTLIIYCVLLLTMRLLGKRQLGEMELSEFVLAALAADLASNPLQDLGIPLINGLIPIVIMFCCEIMITGISLKSIRLRSGFFGRPSLLISKGKINQLELKKNRFTIDELLQELRNQGIMDIGRVEYAVLETDGKLNVFPFAEYMPASAQQLGVQCEQSGYSTAVISDGRVLEANLKHMGKNLSWLQKELKKNGFSTAQEVFLMTIDMGGNEYISAKEKKK